MPSNFLSDLSEGIFERLGGLRREQEAKDEERKVQTLKLLSSLSEQIEPESKPLLMGHLGDVIGIKGKMRKFWDAFSGMPDRSIEDQLGTKLKSISEGMVGSETAKKAREGGDLARLFQPMSPTQEANRNQRLQAEQGLQGKMVFRDPRQEKLEEIQSRYGSQLQQQLQMQNERHQDALERQAEGYRLKGVQDQVRYNQKIFLARDRVAENLFGSGKAPDMKTARTQADAYLANKGEAELDSILAMTGLRRALESKARTEAGALKETGGLKPSDVMARKRFDQGQYDKVRTLHSEFTKAREQARTAITNNAAKERALSQAVAMTGGRFDPATRSFVMSDPTLKPSNKAVSMLNDYLKDLEKESEAKSVMKSRWEQLKQMPDYAEVGPDEWGDIKIKEGIAPAGAPRTGKQAIPPQKPTRPGPKAGIGTSRGQISIPVLDPMKYEVGGRIKFRGRWHKITGLGPDAVMAIPE